MIVPGTPRRHLPQPSSTLLKTLEVDGAVAVAEDLLDGLVTGSEARIRVDELQRSRNTTTEWGGEVEEGNRISTDEYEIQKVNPPKM